MEEIEELIIERISKIDNHDTILVDMAIVPDVGGFNDIEYNEYRIAVHNVELTNEIIDEVIVKFSVSSNPYTIELVESLSEQARYELNGYDLRRIYSVEHTDEPEEEETDLEDAGVIYYVYEVKTKL